MPATKEKLIPLYQALYELTEPECRVSCRCPHSCCSPEYCGMALERMQEWGEVIPPTGNPRLPFLGPKGCVAPPHLRPFCAAHTCDVNSIGSKVHPRPDPLWDKTYFRLRAKIERLEAKLLEET